MFSPHGRRHRAMISSEDIPVTRLNKQGLDFLCKHAAEDVCPAWAAAYGAVIMIRK